MQIDAKIIVDKLEKEVQKLRKSVMMNKYAPLKEHLIKIKTYCDLLNSVEVDEKETFAQSTEKGSMVGVLDIDYLDIDDETTSELFKGTKTGESHVWKKKEKLSPYDDDEKSESDSLLDF